MGPLTAAFLIGLGILVCAGLGLAILLWPDPPTEVRTYHEPQRVTQPRQRLKAIAGTDYRERNQK